MTKHAPSLCLRAPMSQLRSASKGSEGLCPKKKHLPAWLALQGSNRISASKQNSKT